MEIKQELAKKEEIMKKQILDALKCFEADTGLIVTDISINSADIGGMIIGPNGLQELPSKQHRDVSFDYTIKRGRDILKDEQD